MLSATLPVTAGLPSTIQASPMTRFIVRLAEAFGLPLPEKWDPKILPALQNTTLPAWWYFAGLSSRSPASVTVSLCDTATGRFAARVSSVLTHGEYWDLNCDGDTLVIRCHGEYPPADEKVDDPIWRMTVESAAASLSGRISFDHPNAALPPPLASSKPNWGSFVLQGVLAAEKVVLVDDLNTAYFAVLCPYLHGLARMTEMRRIIKARRAAQAATSCLLPVDGVRDEELKAGAEELDTALNREYLDVVVPRKEAIKPSEPL